MPFTSYGLKSSKPGYCQRADSTVFFSCVSRVLAEISPVHVSQKLAGLTSRSQQVARKPRRQTLDDEGVAALKPKSQRYAFPDPEQRSHYVRVQPSGKKTFVVVARDLANKQIWQ